MVFNICISLLSSVLFFLPFFHKYLLNGYIPDTFPGPVDTLVNKTVLKNLAIIELASTSIFLF